MQVCAQSVTWQIKSKEHPKQENEPKKLKNEKPNEIDKIAQKKAENVEKQVE